MVMWFGVSFLTSHQAWRWKWGFFAFYQVSLVDWSYPSAEICNHKLQATFADINLSKPLRFACTDSKNNRLHSWRFTTVGSEWLGAIYGCFRGLSQNSPTSFSFFPFLYLVSVFSWSTRLQISSPPPEWWPLRFRGKSQVSLGSAHWHLGSLASTGCRFKHEELSQCHNSTKRKFYSTTKCPCCTPQNNLNYVKSQCCQVIPDSSLSLEY